MKIISSLPNTGPPTANHDQGEIEDDITPGDGLGTPLRKDWINDIFYGFYEIMKLAGLSPDDSVEGDTQSQVRNAIQAIANGIPAQKFNRATDYTILDTDFYRTIYVDTTAADVTIDMPVLANNIGRKIRIVHQRGGTNKVIIAPDSGDANTLTNDGLAVMWLPKVGDFIDFESQDSTSAVFWAAINERINTQLRLNTQAGYGSSDTRIPRFTNSAESFGNMFSENHSTGYNGNTEGVEITIQRSGVYFFEFTQNGNNNAIGLTLNSAALSTNVQGTPVATKLCLSSSTDSGVENQVSWSGFLNAGDIVRPHASAIVPASTSLNHFTATYLGN